jgi:hypothetical protein
MHRYLCLIFCLCFLAPLHTAQAQICNDYIAASTPDSQLADNGNGTVTDKKTGLMWKKCSEGQTGSNCENGSAAQFTWQAALQQPRMINSGGPGFAGYHDWRLPNIKELRSIVEEKCFEPAINIVRFPNTPGFQWSLVWSSSPSFKFVYPIDSDSPFADNDSIDSWVVSFYKGASYIDERIYGGYHVRLVRGGQ